MRSKHALVHGILARGRFAFANAARHYLDKAVAELPQNELGAQVRVFAKPKPSKYWGAHVRKREGVTAVATGVDLNSASKPGQEAGLRPLADDDRPLCQVRRR